MLKRFAYGAAALVLALAMLLVGVPRDAFVHTARAAETIAIGSATDFIQLSTNSAMKGKVKDATVTFQQTASFTIDITNAVTEEMKATYDGGGYTITVAGTAEGNYLGVFQRVVGGTVRNLKVHHNDTLMHPGSGANAYHGGIVGYLSGGTVSRCEMTGAFLGSQWGSSNQGCVGGIVGEARDSATVRENYVKARVYGAVGKAGGGSNSGVYMYVGGIVGKTWQGATISYNMVDGSLITAGYNITNYPTGTGNNTVAGGILGYHGNSIATVIGNYVRDTKVNADNNSAKQSIAAKLMGLSSNSNSITIPSDSNSHFNVTHEAGAVSGISYAYGSQNTNQVGQFNMNRNFRPLPYQLSTECYAQINNDSELKWRVVASPTITPLSGGLAPEAGNKYLRFAITAPEGVNASAIRYRLTYQVKGTAGAPTARIVDLGGAYTVEFTIDDGTLAEAPDAVVHYTIYDGTNQSQNLVYTSKEAAYTGINTFAGSLANVTKIEAFVQSARQLVHPTQTKTVITVNKLNPAASVVAVGSAYTGGSNKDYHFANKHSWTQWLKYATAEESYPETLSTGMTKPTAANVLYLYLENDEDDATGGRNEYNRIKPGSEITLEAWIDGVLVQHVTHVYTKGDYMLAPTFSPGVGGVIPSSGVVITCSDTTPATIYYSTVKDAVKGDSSWRQYIEGSTSINFAAGEQELTVSAYATSSGGKGDSAISTITYTLRNRTAPKAPTILVGSDKLQFESSTYYMPGTPVYLYHDMFDSTASSNEGAIYYTTSSSVTEINQNNGTKYNTDSPYILPNGQESVAIKAVYIETGYPVSELMEYSILLKGKHGSPGASIRNGSSVSNSQRLWLKLPDRELPANMVPEFYLLEGAERNGLVPSPGEPYNETVHEKRYTEAQVNADEDPANRYYGVITVQGDSLNYQPPSIWYVMGNSTNPIGEGTIYSQDTPEIRFYQYDSGYPNGDTTGAWRWEPENDIGRTQAHTVSPGIALTGQPNDTVNVSIQVQGITGFRLGDGDVSRLSYTIRAGAEAPTAMPATSETDPTRLPRTTALKLFTATPGARIYYTVNGNTPDPDDVGGQSGTAEYTTAGVVHSTQPGDYLTVSAVAVHPSYENSAVVQLRYFVPENPLAPYANLSSGEVPQDSKITLSSSTSGAVIYYTSSTGSASDAESLMNAARGADGSLDLYHTNLIRYDEANPPVVTDVLYLCAVAAANGMESQQITYSYEVYGAVNEVRASPASGSVLTKGSRITLRSSSDATIYYTTDGSDPKKEDNSAVSSGTTVYLDASPGKSVTVRAYAAMPGKTATTTATFTYSISAAVNGVIASPEEGKIVAEGTQVSFSTDVSDAIIHYTTDGSTPTGSSPSGNTVTLSGNPDDIITVKAIAYNSHNESPPVAVFTYKLRQRTAAPTASIPTGAITMAGAAVTLHAQEGVVYYTLDGTEPTTSSARYLEPVALSDSVILKAFALADNKERSETVEYIYTKAGQAPAPTVDIPAGAIDLGTRVGMSCSDPTVVIYYTTDNRTPTVDDLENCMLYTDPIEITRPVTLKMIAYKKGLEPSMVNTVIYTVIEPEIPELPAEDPLAGMPGSTGRRLASRRDYAETQAGASLSGRVLYDLQTLAVVATQQESDIPANTQLHVQEVIVSSSDRSAVRASLIDYDVVSAFEISITSSGVPVELVGQVEVGLPVPERYINGVVSVSRLNEDGTVDTFQARRAGNTAYIMTDKLGKFAIATPGGQEWSAAGRWGWIALTAAAAIGLGLLALFLWRRRKSRQAG